MKTYYIRIDPTPHATRTALGVWTVTDRTAERLGVTRDAPGSYFETVVGESIWEVIEREGPEWTRDWFHPLVLSPGQYYPRIARPNDQHPTQSPGFCLSTGDDRNRIAVARGQMNALTEMLANICQTIHPSEENFQAYGHQIRNLLILACTEVEAHWRAVLTANNFLKGTSTKEYVLLCPAMKLNEYAVSVSPFPWLDPFAPFQDWGTTGKPTKELAWYDAYNAVKHDRDTEFSRSTLQNAFDAVCACYIIIAAQYGFEVLQGSEFRSFFKLLRSPSWHPGEVYTHPYGSVPEVWQSVPYPFQLP